MEKYKSVFIRVHLWLINVVGVDTSHGDRFKFSFSKLFHRSVHGADRK